MPDRTVHPEPSCSCDRSVGEIRVIGHGPHCVAQPNPIPVLKGCFGCSARIADEPGNYYCDDCVSEQTAAQDAELRAFDTLHAFADGVGV